MIDPGLVAQLRWFRTRVYQALGAQRDALFGMLDGAACAGQAPSLVHLGLVAALHQGWGSLYGAPALGGLDVPALRTLLREHPLDDGQPFYALDTSVWRRPERASTSRGSSVAEQRSGVRRPDVLGLQVQPPTFEPAQGQSAAVHTTPEQSGFCAASPAPRIAPSVQTREHHDAVVLHLKEEAVRKAPDTGPAAGVLQNGKA